MSASISRISMGHHFIKRPSRNAAFHGEADAGLARIVTINRPPLAGAPLMLSCRRAIVTDRPHCADSAGFIASSIRPLLLISVASRWRGELLGYHVGAHAGAVAPSLVIATLLSDRAIAPPSLRHQIAPAARPLCARRQVPLHQPPRAKPFHGHFISADAQDNAIIFGATAAIKPSPAA